MLIDPNTLIPFKTLGIWINTVPKLIIYIYICHSYLRIFSSSNVSSRDLLQRVQLLEGCPNVRSFATSFHILLHATWEFILFVHVLIPNASFIKTLSSQSLFPHACNLNLDCPIQIIVYQKVVHHIVY